MAERIYNFIDLFAGCGGLSEGFYKQGFDALAHVEINHFACETLKTRMRYYGYSTADNAVMEQDITAKDIVKKIEKVVGNQVVDIIIGGPPCQSFSPLGKAKDDNNMQEDPRNYLFENYVKVLNHFKPKFFVFENVTGLLDTEIQGKSIFKIILKRLRRHYRVLSKEKTIVLNATSYGVPQERKRVILIGVRRDLEVKPEEVYAAIKKTHYLPGESEKKKDGLKRYVTVRDAIEDLPKLRSGEGTVIAEYPNEYNECSEYVKMLRKPSDKILRDHVARKNNEKDIERYKVMAENHWNFLQLLDFRPDLGHEKKRVFFNSYKVQWWDMPARTIIAHLYKDGNQFIHPDYEQGRSITVREAARLQSFPDDFVFEGSRTEQFKQIGNAVPPMLAEAIAKAIKLKLDELERNDQGDIQECK
ncbi:MAG: DNA cytosine methyltransferase [Acetivibrio ethanolgignens]